MYGEETAAHYPNIPQHLSSMVDTALWMGVQDCQWSWVIGSLVFIDGVTVDGSNRMNSKVYRTILSG